MDMMLPVMSGLAATEHIMAHFPTPILVVSSADRRELFTTYDALAAGAVDVLEKPRGDASDAGWEPRLLRRGQAGVPDPGDHPSAGPADGRAVAAAGRRRRRRRRRTAGCRWSRSARPPAARAR